VKFGYKPALDGLRAICILSVLATHLGIGFPGGFLGVDVFFVLSGFLITQILLGDLDNQNSIDLLHFYLRRARRLLPALFAMLVLAGALWHITSHGYSFFRAAIPVLFYYGNWEA
jgi:peptidoglycan/LPS O-acetylase OafA/YrhL